MIEEITPWVAGTATVLVLLVAPVVTLAVSALLLSRYRSALCHAMAATAGFAASDDENILDIQFAKAPQPRAAPASAVSTAAGASGDRIYRYALRAPWRSALRYAVAGLAFAVAFALAARVVYPLRVDAPGFLLGVWIYAWPVALATGLIVPGRLRAWVLSVAAYFAVYAALGLWAGTVADLPGQHLGAGILPSRSSATPWTLGALWLVVNGAPTALFFLCFTRSVRAVAPLVLALVTVAVSGMIIGWLALALPRGFEAGVAAAVWLGVHAGWIVLGTIVAALLAFGAIGWVFARWIARTYRRRWASDQSLLLDCVWLLFASGYATWLTLGGLAWALTGPAAFLAYKLVLTAARRVGAHVPAGARELTFLRVFALGRRGAALLDTLATAWRHVGTVEMITGPDVARTTVEPHQFLDFLSGRLRSHFVRDRPSLERALVERERTPDPDGRYRINSFFCHADSWQPTLQRLVREGSSVLMDLRMFSAANAGCIHELRELAACVPVQRWLLVIDETTDRTFLDRTLFEAWQHLPVGSPNARLAPQDVAIHRLGRGFAGVRRLLFELCGMPVVAPSQAAVLSASGSRKDFDAFLAASRAQSRVEGGQG